jgi:beta-galactosidase
MSVQFRHPSCVLPLAAVMLAFLAPHDTAFADKTNIALGKPTVISSLESGGNYQANDGKVTTRWGSRFTDNEWYYVDLGSPQTFNKVIIRWQLSYGKAYKIQTSDDAAAWKDAADLTDQKGGVAILTFPAVTARYVKMQGVARANAYGYSFFEFEVYNSDNADDPGPGPEITRGQPPGAPHPSPAPATPPAQRVTTISLGATPAAPATPPAAPEAPATPKPEITSTLSGTGTAGKPFNYTIVATNIPASYAASGLPKGLTLNTGTGQIFGIPAAAGDFKVSLTATNAGGSGTATFSLSVQPPYIPQSVALKQPASASSQGLHPASNGNDGDLKTRWTAADGTFPQSWQVDLGSSKSITKVDIAWQSSGSRVYKYRIDSSSDGSNFNSKVDKTSNTVTGDTSDSFPAITTRYIRVTVTGSSAGFASINEVKVY